LNHESVAARLAEEVSSLSDASCMAIFGSWGRGKTDVLQRLKLAIEHRFGQDIAVVEANPWSSGYSSLLQAVAMAISKYKPVDKDTKDSLKKIGKIGFVLANRFALQRVSGADLEKLAADLGDIWSGGDAPISPAAAAAVAIDDLIEVCFPGKKLAILIDDMDRCPPEWQRPMLESLYFLKRCKKQIVFVCAIDQRTLGHVDMPYQGLDEAGSLCTKIFDLVHDLPRVHGELSEYARQRILTVDPVLGDSIRNRLAFVVQNWDDKISPMNIGIGMCCASELATPRTVDRSIARLRTICYVVKEKLSGFALGDGCTAQGFGLAFALRDRFPTMGRLIAEELPKALEREGGSTPRERRNAENLRNYINAFPVVQRDTLVEAMASANVSLDPHNPGNGQQARKIASGMYLATRL